jgi:hypothetical protein
VREEKERTSPSLKRKLVFFSRLEACADTETPWRFCVSKMTQNLQEIPSSKVLGGVGTFFPRRF